MKRSQAKNKVIFLIFSLFIILVQQAVFAASTNVVGIHAVKNDNGDGCEIELTGSPQYKVFFIGGPPRVVIDLKNATLTTSVNHGALAGTSIKNIRTGAHENGQLRIVLDLQKEMPFHYSFFGDKSSKKKRLFVSLGVTKPVSTAVKPAPKKTTDAATKMQQSSQAEQAAVHTQPQPQPQPQPQSQPLPKTQVSTQKQVSVQKQTQVQQQLPIATPAVQPTPPKVKSEQEQVTVQERAKVQAQIQAQAQAQEQKQTKDQLQIPIPIPALPTMQPQLSVPQPKAQAQPQLQQQSLPKAQVNLPLPPLPSLPPKFSVFSSIDESKSYSVSLLEPDANQKPRDIIVVIDPGHGGRDPGASGLAGVKEKDVVLAIAKDIQHLLNRQNGFSVILTRDGDYHVRLRERLRIAHVNKADVFISLHADIYKNAFAKGASIYALSQDGATSEAARWLAERENASELGTVAAQSGNALRSVLLDVTQTASIKNSLVIADNVLKQLSTVNKLHSKKIDQASFVVLKAPDIPSLLVEVGFISDPKEERNLRDHAYQERFAEALVNGLVNYFSAHPPLGTYLALRKQLLIINN